jgi:hypothetical protein
MRVWTVVALVLGALVLVPDLATAAATRPAPRGYHTVTVKKAGFRIAVPDTWGTVDFTGKNAERQSQKLASRNPELAADVERIKRTGAALEGKLALFAIDRKSSAGAQTVLQVELDPTASLKTPDEYAAGQSQSPQIRDVSAEMTEVARRQAVKVTSTLQGRDRSTGAIVDLHLTVFHFVDAKGKYSVIFQAVGPESSNQDPVVQKIIGSFTLLR